MGRTGENKTTVREYVTVSDAASILGVSVDTVRRWEKAGTITAKRLDGKNRYFDIDELEKFKSRQPLSTTEVAQILGISPSSVRRLENQSLLSPIRNQQGKRLYDKSAIESYLLSIQKPLDKNDIEPAQMLPTQSSQVAALISSEPQNMVDDNSSKINPTKQPGSFKSLKNISRPSRPSFGFMQRIIVYGISLGVFVITMFAVMFLAFPTTLGRFFWGTDGSKNSQNVVARTLEPLAQRALNIVDIVSPDLREKIQPVPEQSQAGLFIKKAGENNYSFNPPSSSYLNIPDKGLVTNLNSEFVQGYEPGEDDGDIAVLPLTGNQIKDGSINAPDIADGAIKLNHLASGVISGSGGSTFVSGSGDIEEVVAGLGLNGGSSGGSATLNVQTGTSTEIVGDGVEIRLAGSGSSSTLSSVSGLEVTGHGVRMLGGCGSGQILKWNGSAWACDNDIGSAGSVDFKTSDNSVVVNGATVVQFGPVVSSSNEFTLTNLGGGQLRVQLGTNVLQTSNYASTLDGVYINNAENPASGDISGSFAGGLMINANSVALGTDTTGNYLATLSGATGLTVTGSGTENAGASISIDVSTTGTTGTSSSNSGLEIGSDGLRLLGGCSNSQILKWNGTSWACAADSFAGSLTLEENESSVTNSATTLDFLGTDFNITESPAGEGNVAIDYTNSGITRQTATEIITGNWTFNDTAFSLQDNIDITKKAVFQLANITTSTTRTYALPDVNGTLITSGNLNDINVVGTITSGTWQGGIISAQYGGTGLNGASAANGQLLIGNGVGYALATITQGNGIIVTNGAGSITVASTLGTTIGGAEVEADAVALGTQTTGNYVNNVTAGNGISVSGTAGEGWSPSIAVLYGSTANTAVQGNTTFTCASGSGNLSGGGNTITMGSGGTCSAITTNSAVSFSTSVTTPLLTTSGPMAIETQATIGSDDIVFSTAGSEKARILENGNLFFEKGTDDVTIAIAIPGGVPATYTFDGATGTVLTTGNYTSSLDSVYVNVGESPDAGDIAGSFSGGLNIGAGVVTNAKLQNSSFSTSFGTNLNGSASVSLGGTLSVGISTTPTFTSVSATTFTGALSGNSSTANALAANPTDCAANQFATTIAANGDLTCGALTDTDIPNSITIDNATSATNLLGSGSTTNAVDLATAEVAGNLRATNLQNAGADLGAANVTIDLSNTNSGGYVTNIIVDGTITAAAFAGALTGNATTATTLATNPTDCAANTFATTIAANGDLTCSSVSKSALANSGTLGFTWSDGEVSDTLTASLFVGSGSTTNAIDLATAEVAGILGVTNGGTGLNGSAASNGQLLIGNGSGYGLATLGQGNGITITNGAGSISIAANIQASKGLETDGNGLSLIDCASGEVLKYNGSNQWACGTDNGTGSAPALDDTYGNDPNGSNVVINLTSTDGAVLIRDNSTPIGGTLFGIQNSAGGTSYFDVTTSGITTSGTINGLAVSSGTITAGAWNGTALTDAYVSDNLTSSIFIGSGSSTNAIDLATAEVAGNLRATNLQSAATDLGAANVNIDLSNTNGSFVTNLTIDGTITAATFSGNLTGNVTGNASTASALAANPNDCSSNQFATTIAANGDLSCMALTDADIPNSIIIDLAATATALAANPSDCSANQFANAIAANGNLTCASITDADVSDTLTASIFIGSGSTTNAIDLATAEIAGNLRATNLQSAGADLGAANVNIDLSNTNGSFVTNLTVDGAITATTFSGNLTGNVTGNASTATALAANPNDCTANSFATAVAANGNLTCISIAANNLPSAAADLGAADVTINLSNTNGSFNTNLTLDGVMTASSFSGALTGNSSTATALATDPTDCSANQFATTIAANGNLGCAALTDSDIPNSITVDLASAATVFQSNPADCAANQFATTIAANGNLTCASLTDADIPDSITVTLAATATALAANPSDCAANQFANAIAANGNLTCATISDSDVPNNITVDNATNATNLIGSGSTTNAVDLATAEVAGILGSSNISGSYTGITGTGVLDAGSIAANFGSINVGSDTITTTGTIGTAAATLFTGSTGTFSTSVTTPLLQGAGLTLASTGANDMILQTNSSTRLTIQSDGDLDVDTGTFFVNATTNGIGINSGTTVNTVTSALTIIPSGGDDINGITIKAPNSTWGTSVGYGKGQVFEYLKQGTGAVDPDDVVLFRIDRTGGLGTAGAVHIATGLRQDVGFAATQAVWINPSIDTRHIVMTGLATQTQGYLLWGKATTTDFGQITADGYLQLQEGSASTPAYGFYDDPNTGIFNSAADVIGFTTGGVEKMQIDASGNIKVQDNLTNSTTKQNIYGLGHYTNAEEPIAVIYSASVATANNIAIGGGSVNHNSANNLIFYTGATPTTTTGSVRMFIDSAGQVGIGSFTPANTPDSELHVIGGVCIETSDTGCTATGGDLQVNGGDVTSAGALTLSSGGGGALTLDSASNTLILAANDATLQRTAAGATTLNLVDGANTTFALTNSGAGVANLTVDGTVTAASFIGALTGNASTATALASNPSDCSTNQFATAIAANGDLTCAGITDADVSDTLTASLFVGSGSTTSAVDLATAEVAGILPVANGGTGANTLNNLVALSTHTTGDYVASLGTLTGLSATGNTGEGSTPTLSVLYGSGANNAAAGANTFTCTSGTGNLTGGGTTVTIGTSGTTCAAINTAAAVSFATSVTTPLIQNAGALTLAATATAGADDIIFETAGSEKLRLLENGNLQTANNFTFDLNSTSARTFTITNSNSGVTALSVEGGGSFGANLTVSAGGVTITGNSTITGTLSGLTGFTVASGGASVSGGLNNNSGGITNAGSIAGATTIAANNTVSTSGNFNVTGTGVYQNDGVSGTSPDCAANEFLGNMTVLGGIITAGACETDDAGLSDLTLKENVVAKSSLIDDIKNLNIVDYNYRCLEVPLLPLDLTCDDRTGVIAQEVALLFPELVSLHHTGYFQVREKSLMYYGLAATAEIADMLDGDGDLQVDSIDTTSVVVSTAATLTDVVDIDANLLLTGDVLNISANALTTGSAISVNTSSSTLTGNLVEIVASGNLLTNTGKLLHVSNGNNILNAHTLVNFTNGGSGLSFRVNDDGSDSDSSPFSIDDTGQVGIGTTTQNDALDVVGSIDATTGFKTNGVSGLSLAACATNQYIGNGVNLDGGIIVGGSCRNDQASDERLKKNVTDLEEGVLEQLSRVRAVSFDFRCDEEQYANSGMDCTTGRQTGVIAQELSEIFPDLVFQDELGYYNVKYQGLSMYTLKAVSEIARYIDSDGNADFTKLNSDQIFTSGIGQQYESAEADLTSGDVVTVSQNGAVRRSGSSYETGLVGVVTSGTGLLVGEQTSSSVTVAAAGKVPVRVNTQNGAIQPGDYLTSSDTPGVAMRATGNGPVIGMATTGFSGAGEGRVTVSVTNTTIAGAFGIQLDGLESRLSQLETRVDEISNGLSQSGQPIDLSNLTVGNLKVTLDMFTDGALVVSGPAEFRGNTIFDALVSFGDSVLFNGDVAVKGTATFNNNTAGYAVISQGRNSVHISFTEPYAQAPLITVSLGGGKFAQYSYNNVTENGFDIVMAGPALEDLKFSWAAMSIDNPNTFVQQ